MIGEVVGNYRITDKIATGGMGVVYKGEHFLIGKKVAIKLLKKQLSENRDVVDRFFNEARGTTAIRHPGIVDIYDFGYHGDNRAFIVMEFLEGETLKKRIKSRGIMAPEVATRIVRSVAGAVGAAHKVGVIHRDLKPDNIFLVPDADMPGGERVKVLDFGLAKLTMDQSASMGTQAGIVLGTPTYMAPEQCDGLGNIDHRADQYALGCILFQLLCGRTPFASDSAFALLQAQRFELPPPPRSLNSAISPALEAIILKLLAKDPGARYADMDEVRAALDLGGAEVDTASDTLLDEPSGSHSQAQTDSHRPGTAWPSQQSSVSASNGQVVSAPAMRAASVSGHGVPSHSMIGPGSRPVRLPSVPPRRRISPLYWVLGGVLSILIGFGIVYAVASLSRPQVIIMPVNEGESPPSPPAPPPPAGGEPSPTGAADELPAGAPADSSADAVGEPGDDGEGEPDQAIELESDEPDPTGDDLGAAPEPDPAGEGSDTVAISLRMGRIDGAVVEVDGHVRTDHPLVLARSDRTHAIRVTAPGRQPWEVQVRANRDRRLRVALEPAGGAAAKPASEPAGEPASAADPGIDL
ncbi:serine/threonine-protein kinase [Haliangium sp.]|uniref:serine/threonine-protein kinase n=1 Tax=Haliangium sp. TaxID=2663208 RepID=UPI003D125342